MANPVAHSEFTKDQILASFGKNPIALNGYWWTWNTTSMEYENTGVAAEAAAFAQEAEDSALDAEAWAVGTRGGVDVTDDDTAYNNNAKYFMESARQLVNTEIPVSVDSNVELTTPSGEGLTNYLGARFYKITNTTAIPDTVGFLGAYIKISGEASGGYANIVYTSGEENEEFSELQYLVDHGYSSGFWYLQEMDMRGQTDVSPVKLMRYTSSGSACWAISMPYSGTISPLGEPTYYKASQSGIYARADFIDGKILLKDAVRSPMIRNDTWQQWNSVTRRYESTGESARGIAGKSFWAVSDHIDKNETIIGGVDVEGLEIADVHKDDIIWSLSSGALFRAERDAEETMLWAGGYSVSISYIGTIPITPE